MPVPLAGLEIIMGPMFAGKTTELLRRMAAYEAAGLRVALVKSAKDVRYSPSEVVSHDGLRAPAAAAYALADVEAALGPERMASLQVLGIDEAQFFGDLAQHVVAWADGRGLRVVVAGLDGDYRRERFGQLLDLVPHADSVAKLSARCGFCSRPALFSLRRPGEAAGRELIGGADKYLAACRSCYVEHHVEPPPAAAP